MIIGVIIKTSFAVSLGEELGPWRTVLVSGILRGSWHLSFVLLATGYHYDGNRVIVMPTFLVSLTIAGMFLASGEARALRPSTAAFVAGPLSTGQRASPPKG